MSELINDIRVRCRLNILRLYPAHRQAQLSDRTDFDAWKAENVAYMQKLIDSGAEDIDEGWPDPKAHERKEGPTPAEAMLDELEATKEKLDATKPPEEIASFFDGKPHGIAAAEMLREINDLASLIQLGLATDEQRAKHTVLSRHAPYLRSKAVDLV